MRSLPGGRERFRREAGTNDGGLRRRVFFYQIEAELAAATGNVEWALDALRRSVDAGLIDALWIERCPLFAGLRTDPRMVTLVSETSTRARGILSAFLDA